MGDMEHVKVEIDDYGFDRDKDAYLVREVVFWTEGKGSDTWALLEAASNYMRRFPLQTVLSLNIEYADDETVLRLFID